MLIVSQKLCNGILAEDSKILERLQSECPESKDPAKSLRKGQKRGSEISSSF